MGKLLVNLNSIEAVKKTVLQAEKLECFNVYIVSGKSRVSASSLMGVYSVASAKPLEVHYTAKNADKVKEIYGEYIVEGEI